MTRRNQILWSIVGLCVIDVFLPIPILGLTLIYVILEKPKWFRDMVTDVYGGA